MNRAKELRKSLGERYTFKRWVSGQELFRLQRYPPEVFYDTVVAELVVGCVKMEAVAFKDGDRIEVGYDIFVKDAPDMKGWICYDVVNKALRVKESEMLAELDKYVKTNGLSYTESCFEKLDGIDTDLANKPFKHPP